ncbi:DNA-3-methyladenine glycosylase 2 family protein [Candidatus Woesebacteria bacterium]|nr:DNA-3-methyladenine glycosylase 2 family protein [Candidatus Woesebacteria bacterium]
MWGAAEKILLRDRYIGPLIKRYGPCKIRPSKKKDYFVDLVDAITSQQLSGKAARTIFERVKERCGGEITPEKLGKLKTEELRKCGLSYAKCSYIKDLAQRVKSSKLKIKILDKLTDEEVMKELIAVKGIGKWTAEMFLMFSLARPDVFPVDDLGIQKGIHRLLKRRISSQKIGKFAERWKPFRTPASWYLWKVIDND